MAADYTGLHGRSPWETTAPHFHAVPEGWEDLDRGICPWCGRTVTWDDTAEAWVLDPDLVVLVLTKDEYEKVLDRSRESDSGLAEMIQVQYALNRPLAEVTDSTGNTGASLPQESPTP